MAETLTAHWFFLLDNKEIILIIMQTTLNGSHNYVGTFSNSILLQFLYCGGSSVSVFDMTDIEVTNYYIL